MPRPLPGARPSKSSMPRPLPDKLLEEVLRHLPPLEPAELVHAALVSRRWCRLVSDPGFRRRFREFHRSPPMLGILCNFYDEISTARFIPTTAFGTPRTDFQDMSVLDARHGRVLCEKGRDLLVVWDPITNEVQELPFPEKRWLWAGWDAAILCSAAGACDHLDCHHGPFLIVFVFANKNASAVIYTYSSDVAAWSEPVIGQDYIFTSTTGSALVGNALYFRFYPIGRTTLKYNFELHQMSLIQLPSSLSMGSLLESPLTTTEDGGLGLINKDDSKLYLWSREDTHEVDAIWERRVIIELNTVFPVDVDVTKLVVIGFDVGIIFMSTGDEADEAYTIDLKTYKVKKAYEGTAHTIFPYMSFYTPAALDIKFMAIDLNQAPEDGEGEPLLDLNTAPDQADDEGQEDEHAAGVQDADLDGQPPVNQSEHHFDLNISASQENEPAHDEHDAINSALKASCSGEEPGAGASSA